MVAAGQRQRPIILLNHTDVVSSDPSHWSHPPFSGALDKGVLYGRGAQDMKNEGLAPLVVEAAREGDYISREILRVAGRELGLLAAAVLQRLNWEPGETVRVSGIGAVFTAGNILTLPMEQVIHSACPQAEMCQPKHTPAYGAALLALRAVGINLEEAPGERS
jgi:N-acetylglucosamine kinase-like BadF-type ATPase